MDAPGVRAMCRTVQFVVKDWARTLRLITILVVVLIVLVMYRQLIVH
jgi:hypothetical protein